MVQAWVKLDLNYTGGDVLIAPNVPSYTTTIDGYSVQVYYPFAQPFGIPDTAEEYLVTGQEASIGNYLGGVLGNYLGISVISFWYEVRNPDNPNGLGFDMVFVPVQATATEISFTQPPDTPPPFATTTRFDDRLQSNVTFSVLSQARGGPMLTGHNSHQIGLDADIWLTPMPDRELTRREREEMSATMMVAADRKDVDPEVWTPAHTEIIKAAAKDPIVERIFVNAAIKKALCREAGNDRSWLHKVRPYYGHDYHFHVRIKCPADSPDCRPQDPVPAGEVCGNDLDHWFTDAILYPKPSPIPSKPKPPLTMADLPPACRQVLMVP